MPVELGVWRIDEQLSRVPVAALDSESHLEGLLDRGIEIANPNGMLVGRRRVTGSGSTFLVKDMSGSVKSRSRSSPLTGFPCQDQTAKRFPSYRCRSKTRAS